MRIHLAFIFACIAFLALPVHAHQNENQADPPVAENGKFAESEIARYERELANRLVEVAKAEQVELEQRLLVESLQARLERARKEADDAEIQTAAQAYRSAEESLARLAANARAAKELYDQANTKLEIAKKNAQLESKKSESAPNGQTHRSPLDDVLQKRGRVALAAEEAELAQKKTLTLRQQLETLLNRQQEIRRISDRLSQRLSGSDDIASDQRKRLWDERQEYVEAGRRVAEDIQQLREEILVAEATQQIKEESAQAETVSFEAWKTDLLKSAILFASLLSLLIAIRVVIAGRIHDPSRKYYFNKALSLLTTVLLVVGLALIFADQFANLLTLFGLAVAGITIALQEVVASFAAWFFIRSPRGYRAGDWVQIGENFGEVIDIGFLRTTLKQHQLLANDGRPDGGLPTGGLVVLMNNAAFKSPLINYTREFPFVWVSLRYNFTFESNWERAREVILEALNSEPEIADTVRQANQFFEEMAENFAVKQDSLDPVVRSWTAGVGVELTARFLAHPRRRAHLIDTVNLKILRKITQSEDIRFAYWTIRSVSTPGKTVPQNEQPHPQDPLTAK